MFPTQCCYVFTLARPPLASLSCCEQLALTEPLGRSAGWMNGRQVVLYCFEKSVTFLIEYNSNLLPWPSKSFSTGCTTRLISHCPLVPVSRETVSTRGSQVTLGQCHFCQLTSRQSTIWGTTIVTSLLCLPLRKSY